MKYVAVTRDVVGFRQPLPEEHIARLCQHAFGRDARPRTCQLLESGKFNTSYRIELSGVESVILRVAPPANAILFTHEQLLLRRESAVQPILHALSDKIPRNLFEDFTREHCDRDYVIQNCLPGILWDDIKTGLSAVENESLWSQLAPIVRSVHGIPGKHFGFPRPVENFDSWAEAVVHWITGMVGDMQRLQLPCADARVFLSLVESGRRVLDEVIQPGLVHGDLWPKNVLVMRVADELQVTGVLDAERAFWGDTEAEWIFSFLDLPPGFWRHYGRLGVDRSSVFRRLIYTGRGSIQLCLEAWRFRFDDSPFRRNLQRVIRELGALGA